MPASPAAMASFEASRLAALRALRILDTLPEQVYDDLVLLASQICGTPISLVSLVDSDRQWFKARVGLGVSETHRDLAFCALAIVSAEPVFIVEDTARDPRFQTNVLVIGEPHIRFYAGAPIVMSDGHAVGTVCVIDTVPRTLDAVQVSALQALARQASALLELRLQTQSAARHALELESVSAGAAVERQRSTELLELVLRGGNLGLWDLDVPSANYSVNEREHAMFGYSALEARPGALDWRNLIHPDDWPTLNRAIVPHLKGEAAFYECEHRMQHRDGHWVWVLVHAVIVKRDAEGVPVRIVGTHMDITESMRNRLTAQRALNLLERMGAMAQVGGWDLNLKTRKVTWTDEIYRIHEIDRATSFEPVESLDFYAPEARPILQAAVDGAVRNGTPFCLELPFVTAKGRPLTARVQGELLLQDGKEARLVGIFQDITERKRIEAALVDSEQRLRLVADNLPAVICYVDREERYRFINAQVERSFGVRPQDTLGRTMREMRGDEVYAKLAPYIAGALRGEPARFEYSVEVQGRTSHFRSDYIPDRGPDGSVRGFYTATFDITDLKNTQAQLDLLARVDTLTGLPNRRLLDERIHEAMARTSRTGQAVAVMFLDLDHFKAINDSLGHAGGDAVLCEFARRLKSSVRATDTVARIAGDEFVVLLENIDGVTDFNRLADKVVACIRPRFHVANAALHVTTSAGMAIYAGGEQTAAEVLSLADGALYLAKRQGRDRYVMA